MNDNTNTAETRPFPGSWLDLTTSRLLKTAGQDPATAGDEVYAFAAASVIKALNDSILDGLAPGYATWKLDEGNGLDELVEPLTVFAETVKNYTYDTGFIVVPSVDWGHSAQYLQLTAKEFADPFRDGESGTTTKLATDMLARFGDDSSKIEETVVVSVGMMLVVNEMLSRSMAIVAAAVDTANAEQSRDTFDHAGTPVSFNVFHSLLTGLVKRSDAALVSDEARIVAKPSVPA